MCRPNGSKVINYMRLHETYLTWLISFRVPAKNDYWKIKYWPCSTSAAYCFLLVVVIRYQEKIMTENSIIIRDGRPYDARYNTYYFITYIVIVFWKVTCVIRWNNDFRTAISIEILVHTTDFDTRYENAVLSVRPYFLLMSHITSCFLIQISSVVAAE